MNHTDQTKGSSFSLARVGDALKSVPVAVQALLAVAGLAAILWQPVRDLISPPASRSGTITILNSNMQPMTLGDYLAYLQQTHTSNAIADSAHAGAAMQQSGRLVPFVVQVTGYRRHPCEIEYDVRAADGSAVVAETSLVTFEPMADTQRLEYDLWVPAPQPGKAGGETVDVRMYESPRPPGAMLDAQPLTVAWK